MSWWRDAVVYQVYPRSFADSDGDGVGDLRGLINHIDHLAALGVDVLWLSPIYPSPQVDNGYDISDYQDIDPLFGTFADFDELVAALHSRRMALMLDVVLNHTSDQHPWFQAARSSRDDPKRDWYIWRDQPNNWGSYFGGSAWELDEGSGQYYLHTFAAEQPELNWENPELRQALYAMLRWWLDRGVDAFRFDVINLISKDPLLPDGAAIPGFPYGDSTPHFVNGPRIHEYLAELHRAVIVGRERRPLTVGETPFVTVEQARRYTDPARGELDMVFAFDHVSLDQGPFGKFDVQPLRLTALKEVLERWQVGLAEVGWNSLYWDNHDQPRIVSRFGDDGEHRVRAAKMLATVLHLHRGTPYVYQGEELGMTNAPFDGVDDFQDVEARGHYAARVAMGADPDEVLDGMRKMARDNARTPMQWDASPNAGFTDGQPWLPVNPNYREINAAAQRPDPDSVFNHYRRLIALRRREPAVVDGVFAMLLRDDEQVYAFTRTLGDVQLLVLGNFSPETVEVELPDWKGTEVLLGEEPEEPGTLTLRPWEGRIHRRRT